MALWRLTLPLVALPAAGCSGAEAPVIGAAAGVGGWLLAAPGTPVGASAPLACVSRLLWLRMAASSGFWFGR